MINVVIWGWHTPSAIAAVREIESKNLIKIVEWVGDAADCTIDLDRLVHQFKMDSYSYTGAAENIYDKLYQSLPQFLEFYSRVSFSLGKSYQQQLHIFNVYIDYFANLLISGRVDLVLFSNLPHFGVDYLLYLVAKQLGIQVVMTNQTHVGNRFYYTDDLEDFGVLNFAVADTTMEYLHVDKKYEKSIFFMGKEYIKKATRKKNCYASLLNDLLHVKLLKKSKPMTFTGAIQKFEECLAFNRFARRAMITEIDVSRKYAYFPLQLQPELTTSTLGGRYADQLLAIEHLSSMIPGDWLIYVKENPKQNRRQREGFFFERLSRIKKAVYVSVNINTYDLISNCQFVAVVTGTAGWEAISGGKNALVFGKAWYRKLPGVFEYRPELTVEQITSFQVNHQDLERRYNELLQRTARGVVDPYYSVLVKDYSDGQNSRYLFEFLQKFLARWVGA